MTFAVGDDAILVDYRGETQVTVVKVGRKWAYFEGDYRLQVSFDKETGEGKPDMGFPARYRVYTPEGLIAHRKHLEILKRFKEETRAIWWDKDLTDDQREVILTIIEQSKTNKENQS
jgi:hypothetical protein